MMMMGMYYWHTIPNTFPNLSYRVYSSPYLILYTNIPPLYQMTVVTRIGNHSVMLVVAGSLLVYITSVRGMSRVIKASHHVYLRMQDLLAQDCSVQLQNSLSHFQLLHSRFPFYIDHWITNPGPKQSKSYPKCANVTSPLKLYGQESGTHGLAELFLSTCQHILIGILATGSMA